MIYYRYATIQQTTSAVYLFMDNDKEVPTMLNCSWSKEYAISERREAISFAIRWALIKVTEIKIIKGRGAEYTLIYIKDPNDKKSGAVSPIYHRTAGPD